MGLKDAICIRLIKGAAGHGPVFGHMSYDTPNSKRGTLATKL